jgi:hypothetical protein
MTSWWQELENPPTEEQLNVWSEIRDRGHWRYLWKGIWWVTWQSLLTWCFACLATDLWFQKQMALTSLVAAIMAGAGCGWVLFRDRWAKNEKFFLQATRETTDAV